MSTYSYSRRKQMTAVVIVVISMALVAAAPAPERTPICVIQGAGAESPVVGQQVTTTGVVIAVDGNGVWIQDPGCDENSSTSNGLFAFRGEGEVGQRVRVTGEVNEFFGLTEIEVDYTNVFGEIYRPRPIMINPVAAGRPGYYEDLEGMRVRLPRGQTYVGTNKFGETFLTPGNTATRIHRTEKAPAVLALDDGLPGVGPVNAFAFDVVKNAVGPLSFTFGNYKLLVANPDQVEVVTTERSSDLSAPVAAGPRGALSVATWNLANVFDEIEDGGPGTPEPTPEEQAVKRAKVARGIVDQLAAPAVVAVQEIEKRGLLEAIADATDRYAASQGLSTDYMAVIRPGNDPRGIEPGFLLDISRVAYGNVRQLAENAVTEGPCEGPLTGGALVFKRPPLAVDVRPVGAPRGAAVTVVSNHFKSKFGGTPENEFFEPCRVEQAQALRKAVRGLNRVMLVGDFNAFVGSPTLEVLTAGGYVNLVGRIPKERRFSYAFQGRVQFLDHIVVSPSLRQQVATVDSPKLDIDVPFPKFEDDPTTGFATSDHDPLIAYVRLPRKPGPGGQPPFGAGFPFGGGSPFEADSPFGVDFSLGEDSAFRADFPFGFVRQMCAPGVGLLGFSDSLNKKTYAGTDVGGLSDLVYDKRRGVYYALVDNQGATPARFYTVRVPVHPFGIGSVEIKDVTFLHTASGERFTGRNFDGEGIALTRGHELLIASEAGPSIRRFSLHGELLGTLPVPDEFLVAPQGRVRNNRAFESLALSPNGHSLFTAVEAPLRGDGRTESGEGRIRILRYDDRGPGGFRPAAQFFYLTEPGQYVTEIVALSEDELLVLERSFTPGEGNTIRIFRVFLEGAADVSGERTLAAPGLEPIEKFLLVDAGRCPPSGAKTPGTQQNPLLDNYEGLTLGPRLLGGRRALLLVSDDNFNDVQVTRIVGLAAELSPAPHSSGR